MEKKTAQINADHRNGNLHINLDGRFTTDSAELLTLVMAGAYKGAGNIFIHTRRVTEVAPDSRVVFLDLQVKTGLPKDNIYLTGEKGLDICHDAGKVIVRKEKSHGHTGCGKCGNCTCGKKRAV
jgi:hypothetical protein